MQDTLCPVVQHSSRHDLHLRRLQSGCQIWRSFDACPRMVLIRARVLCLEISCIQSALAFPKLCWCSIGVFARAVNDQSFTAGNQHLFSCMLCSYDAENSLCMELPVQHISQSMAALLVEVLAGREIAHASHPKYASMEKGPDWLCHAALRWMGRIVTFLPSRHCQEDLPPTAKVEDRELRRRADVWPFACATCRACLHHACDATRKQGL